MRRAVPLLLALVAFAGCGSDDSDGSSASAGTATSATSVTPATTTAAPPATTTAPVTTTPKGDQSPYVVVTSLLGKQLPQEPGCRFAKSFVPDKPSASGYDGALTLTVTCQRADNYTPVGQIVNRAGSKPSEITCRETQNGQLYCIYVPSTHVGLYFTGTDRAVVRRRLEHLIEIVQPLPTGLTPLSGSTAR